MASFNTAYKVLEQRPKVGVGLRHQHFEYICQYQPQSIGWFEIISENFLQTHGRPLHYLDRIRADYPIAMHGVSLSIAGAEPIRQQYLVQLKQLIERIDPFIVSDHLCWTGLNNNNLHNLLPFPYTEENLHWIASRVLQVQEYIKRPIALENLSAYFSLTNSTMNEQQFLVALSKLTDCKILLDINNVYVNARNQGFNALEFLQSIPVSMISHFHLAGHSDMGTHLFDTHSAPVCQDVWQLFQQQINRCPQIPTLIEWDEDIPDFPILEQEALKAQNFINDEMRV